MTNSEVLQKYFGFNTFKDIQEDVINNLLLGQNTLCLMPTGGGKSIIYQVAGLQTGKITIVISPLLALMKQQNKRLAEQGINVMSYNSSLGDLKTQFNKLKKAFSGNDFPQFIFVSPEKIISDGYLEYLIKKYHSKIGLIVVDEAHCISQWGHTFRPAYKTLPLFIENVFGAYNIPPVLCLTATLNPLDKVEICGDLNISQENIFVSNTLLRSNLHLSILEQVDNNEQKKAQLVEILNKHKDEKVIVYTHIKTRDYGTREMSEAFSSLGFNCHYFDADMQDNDKLSILEKFENGHIKIIFATSAFGMGIDIPDIRVVVHYLIPESIEQYYQEVGRAGRDGKAAYGYLLYSQTNFKIRRDLIKKSLLKENRILDIFETTIKPTSNTSTKRKTLNQDTSVADKIYSLSKMDIKEDNSEMIVFLFLLQYGVVKLHGKGVQFFDCFENNGSGLFNIMKEASINGMVTRISKKLNKSIEQTNYDIFTMYNQDEIKLTKAPVNVMNYSVPELLSDDLVEEIHSILKSRVEGRLENFEKLVSFISSESDLVEIIAQHLGVTE
ncbi:RecQ family ATP-dependent DNA helicase [Pontibacter chitinilyticus]|uniref:RecQ family ATP-dependent DNA helicase n=1 Tax=Pontibacter chitinilyticus TaxID=2674989 RepID=UPI00321B9C86